MKKLILSVISILALWTTAIAQSPESFQYQAVIRDGSGQIISNQSIGIQISVLQGSANGPVIYQETFTQDSNVYGLLNLQIGTGTPVQGSFTSINWGNNSFFIETAVDVSGGSNYTIMGASQLMSVPYALHAKSAEEFTGTLDETDPVFTAWDRSAGISITESQISDLQNYLTTEEDASVTNELQALSISNDTIYLTDGGFVKLPEAPDETDPSVPTGSQAGDMQYWNGAAWITVAAGNTGDLLTFINGMPRWVESDAQIDLNTGQVWKDVVSPTGRIWMDRNLGASQVATSSTDSAAYGDLYQWGRAADGHQLPTSNTTTTIATGDSPGHGDFILVNEVPRDWRNPQNDDLWQGTNGGTNNPCPSGYRLPTLDEWITERQSWSSSDAAGAYASPLKLPMAGVRLFYNGTIFNAGSEAAYWSSSTNNEVSQRLRFGSNYAGSGQGFRSEGFSVRCIKD